LNISHLQSEPLPADLAVAGEYTLLFVQSPVTCSGSDGENAYFFEILIDKT